MHINLTTAFNPGDLDPGKTYPHVVIPRIGMDIINQALTFDWEYGLLVSTPVTVAGIGLLGASGTAYAYNWTKGIGSFTKSGMLNATPFMQAMYSSPLISTDNTLNVILRSLYQSLLTAGTVTGSIANP